MSEPRFDELIHPSTRLSIVALLAGADWAEFSFLRDRLDLSDSALSKQLSTLEEARYVDIDRPVRDRRRRVRARLTAPGREAFTGHVAALRQIVGSAELANGPPREEAEAPPKNEADGRPEHEAGGPPDLPRAA